MRPVIAIAAGLGAAAAFGISAVAEQRSTKQVPRRRTLAPRLLIDLLRRPAWLGGITANIAGLAFQIVALHFGPLALVQPLLAGDVLFAVLISALIVRRHRPDRIMLAGVVSCAGGIAGFLAIARPRGGRGTPAFLDVVPVVAALAAVLALCLVAAYFASRTWRPIALALAAGASYGVTAFLLKLVTQTFGQGFTDPLRQWPLYIVAVTGPVGFLLNQNAFQAGVLVSPVVSVITTTDPLVSIGLATLLLHESVMTGPLNITGEVASLAVMTAGIIALAERAPQAVAQRGAAARHQLRGRGAE